MNNQEFNTNDDDVWNEMDFSEVDLQKLLDKPFQDEHNLALRETKNHAGFDGSTGDNWIYPNNLPLRAYQLSIVQKALFENTLVVLPTGLGKTFIAAVVMYNMYRWYPTGKILFLAPTKPLVNQQIEACHKIMPFPSKDTIELTGKLLRGRRLEFWKSKRVFFATPQVIQSDMNDTNDAVSFPFDDIKLIVFDEAHKAKGRYAFTEVCQKQFSKNPFFRVLALSATPGRTMEDVAEVVRNLFISHLEVRWDSSPDVLPYIHQRNFKNVVVKLNDKIKEVRDSLLEIIDPYMRQLIDAEVLSGSITNINRNYLLYEHKHFKENCLQHRHPDQSKVNSNFSTCIALYHAKELLERHGLRVFVNYFDEDEEGRNNFIFNKNYQLRKLIEDLREYLGPSPLDYSTHSMTNGEFAKIPKDLDFGHPKFEEARKCLLEHFQGSENAQAIVFCEYRESVTLMHRLLLQHYPTFKPRCFVGQGGSGGSLKPLTQKDQLQIMKDFRSGICNILIATSVGEEGIDVGEVDMVVCFDISTANPTRFVQRIGRTGRKKNGHVVMLVTEGREHQLLKDVLATKDQNNKKLLTSPVVKNALYQHCPRLIPTEFNPRCLQTFVKIDEEARESKSSPKEEDKKKKKASAKQSKFLKGSQDLRKFFHKTSDLDKEEKKFFQSSGSSPGISTQKLTEESFKKINNFFQNMDLPIVNIVDTQEEQKSIDRKKLRKLNKLLQKPTSLMSSSEVQEDVKTQLTSKHLTKNIKLNILKRNRSFLKEICDKNKILKALDESDADMLGPAEMEVRKLYKIIELLLGSEKEVENFLDHQVMDHSRDDSLGCTNNDYFNIENLVNECLLDFEDQGSLCNNCDFIESKAKEYRDCSKSLERFEGLTKPCLKLSTVFDYDTYGEISMNSNLTEFVESKYCDKFSQEESQKFSKVSTPLTISSKKFIPKSLRNSLDKKSQNLSVLEQLAENSDNEDQEFFEKETKTFKNSKEDSKQNHDISDILSLSSTPEDIKGANDSMYEGIGNLDVEINFDDFLEPFPEETSKKGYSIDKVSDSQKENFDSNLEQSFSEIIPMINENKQDATKETNPPNLLSSPQNRKKFDKSFETSPSIFDMYVKKVKHRTFSQLEKSCCETKNKSTKLLDNSNINDESVIIRRNPNSKKPRKILDSDSESDFEPALDKKDEDLSIAISSENESPLKTNRRLKKRKLEHNSFIEGEAVHSGSEGSQDELEHTIGCYLKDSVIVSSGDESDDASRSHMQEIYLKSLKSPVPKRGAFKIPAPRVYNDHSHIFSQAVLDEGPSQYIADSFVVSDEEAESSKDKSLCPLEKAERILKERRRAKRKNFEEVGVIQKRKRRKICHLASSSDDDFQ